MKKGLFTFLILILAFVSNAQQPVFEWVKSFKDSIYNNHAISNVIDKNGNLYTIGTFGGTIDFDPSTNVYNLTSMGWSDSYVTKIDSLGNLIWAKCLYGSGNYDFCNEITIDSNNNLYIVGGFDGTLSCGIGIPILGSNGDNDNFICKLDSSGNCIWSKKFGGTGLDRILSIKLDDAGNIYTSGNYEFSVDFDPGVNLSQINSNGNHDIYISKLDNNGNFIWAKSFGGTFEEQGGYLSIDKNGDCYLTGIFRNLVDFDPNIGIYNLNCSTSNYDVCVVKIDSNGNFITAIKIGNSSNLNVYTIGADNYGNITIAGYYYGTVDFDPSVLQYNLTSNGSGIYICNFNSNLNLKWVKSITSNNYKEVYNIEKDKYGDNYLTGSFEGLLDFNPDLPINYLNAGNSEDIFILKLDSLGNYKWATNFGGKGWGRGTTTAIDDNGIVYSSGVFSDSIDFNPDLNSFYLFSSSYNSSFIHKMSQCLPSFKSLILSSCNSYNFNGNILTTSGIYHDTLINSKGCDSLLTLNLTIGNQATSNTINLSTCNNYLFNGQNLIISGVYYDTLINSIGCDSLLTLNLTLTNQDIYTYTSYKACHFYNMNGQIVTQSGLYIDTLVSVNGCDSISYFQLNIQNFDTTLSHAGNSVWSNTASSVLSSYQWIDCDANAVIPGATSQGFISANGGVFAVILNYNGCIDTSECYSIFPLNVQDVENNNLNIYPNPTKGIFNLISDKPFQNTILKIYNLTGEIVFEKNKIIGNEIVLDISKHSNGFYIVEIINGINTNRIKLVKEE